MSTVKRIVSEFYKLDEAKALNDKLLSLTKGHKILNFEESEEIFKLVKQPRCYYDLDDYVKGSEKYNEILQDRKAYEKAQDALKELQHTCIQVVDEYHPYTLAVYQHSVVVLEYPEHYDDYDSNEESPVTRVFFTAYSHMSTFSYKKRHVVTDFNDLLISYIKDEGRYNQSDLIDDALRSITYFERMVQAYKLAEKLKTSFDIICKIFNFKKLKYFTEYYGGDFVKYNGVKYSYKEILGLIKEYEIAVNEVYIINDKYEKYPAYIRYADFRRESSKVMLP